MNELLTSEQLSEWAACKQRARLIRWLNENRIAYRLNAKGEPVSTLKAVNDSLSGELDDEKVAF